MNVTITIVGYGTVGRVLTNMLLGSDLSGAIHIVDPADHLSGAFLDLKHALVMQPNKRVSFNEPDALERSDFVFFTAGVPSKHGASRLTTVNENLALVTAVFSGKKMPSHARVIAITNPVDVITAAILKQTGLPKEQVVGTGTFLDSMRFSYYLSELANVDYNNLHTLILGEHGASCAAILSLSTFKGEPLGKQFPKKLIDDALFQAKNAAFEIRKTEPGTSVAVSHCAIRIMEAWLSPTKTSLPLSILLNDESIEWLQLKHPICISVPVTISQEGITLKTPLPIANKEWEELHSSAKILLEYQSFLAE